MSRLDIERFSEQYAVRVLSYSDVSLIHNICKGNTIYYEHCGRENTTEDIYNDLTITPPGKDLSDKYYVGFFCENHLIAVMDLIDGYPNDSTAFIGFFMMNIDYQGKGIGTGIITQLLVYLKQAGFKMVRLGIDKGNPQSTHFWHKNGFKEVKEVPQERGIIVLAEREI